MSTAVILDIATSGKKLKEGRESLQEWLKERAVEKDGKKTYQFGPDDTAEFKKRNDELSKLGDEHEEAVTVAKAAEENAKALAALNAPIRPPHDSDPTGDPLVKGGMPQELMGLGDLFVQSQAYKGLFTDPENLKGFSSPGIGPVGHVDYNTKALFGPLAAMQSEVKTLFETTAGWDPESFRLPRVELTPERILKVVDLPFTVPTGMDTIPYMKETTFTSGAAEIAEAAAYGEATLVLTEQTSPVRKIGTFIPVSDEQLEDVAMVQGYLNARLGRMVRARLDGQIITGNGVAPNLEGILNVTGIQTRPKGADDEFTAVFKGLTLARHASGYSEPDAIVCHPNDWETMRTLQDSNGNFILGPPGITAPERLFGLRVVVTNAETENTVLIGAWRDFAGLFLRRGLTFQVSNSHDDYFVKGKQAVRVDMRVALVAFRPEAFVTVTGM